MALSPLIPQINYGAGNIPENWTVLLDPTTGQAMFTGGLPGQFYTPGGLLTVSGNFTRPADTTAYAAGDLVANSTTALSVLPIMLPSAARGPGEAIRLERARLRKSNPSLTNAAFRVHIFRTLPALTVGDNGVFSAAGVLATTITGYVGSFSITMDLAGSDGARGVALPSVGSGMTVEPFDGSTLYALIEATGAYTPASGEVFTLTVEGARS